MYERGCLKSKKFKHRVSEVKSFTEKAVFTINTLCISVTLSLCIEISIETASFFIQVF